MRDQLYPYRIIPIGYPPPHTALCKSKDCVPGPSLGVRKKEKEEEKEEKEEKDNKINRLKASLSSSQKRQFRNRAMRIRT